jgi:hypothetical protein
MIEDSTRIVKKKKSNPLFYFIFYFQEKIYHLSLSVPSKAGSAVSYPPVISEQQRVFYFKDKKRYKNYRCAIGLTGAKAMRSRGKTTGKENMARIKTDCFH